MAKSVDLDLQEQVGRAINQGSEFLFSIQRDDFHWCAELESNATITSEYVFLHQMLGLSLKEKTKSITSYFFNQQNPDGGWGIALTMDSDISTTVEVYLALRILGHGSAHEVLQKAEKFILQNGGIEKVRIFTRISLAMFGLMHWDAIPVLPPEFILLPPQSPVNVYSISSWARSTIVPLLVIFHHQPVYPLPNGLSPHNSWLDHLWHDPKNKKISYSDSWVELLMKYRVSWKTFFGTADFALRIYERVRVDPIREKAVKDCVQWILNRQEKSGDWAGIIPPMTNGVLALTLEGYAIDSEPVVKGLKAIESFSWQDDGGFRIQSCVSPLWDTVLSSIGLSDCNVDKNDPKMKGAIQWILDRQILADHGDWRIYRPQLLSGGWSFEYNNTWYPDVDDTAAAILSLLKQNPELAASEAMRRAAEWTLGMQNHDGGWAAFDVDNDKTFLNEIPFSDMDSLCDPSSPDVAGRVLEAFGLLLQICETGEDLISKDLEKRIQRACERGLVYLQRTQEKQGAWFGRWGVNYIYGTSNVLCGLMQMKVPASDTKVKQALKWLKHVQNDDGGWGESLRSYEDQKFMGVGASTASQTAWALMGLLSYLPHTDETITRGIRWLVKNQQPATASEGVLEAGQAVPSPQGSTWDEREFTGTGFPKHFYIRYNLYRHYFPMMALGRYLQAIVRTS